MRILAIMRFVNPSYPLSELTRDVIAGFYRSYDAFGFGFRESAYRRVLSVELRHAGLAVQSEVPFELFHLGERIRRYRVDLIVERTLIVEVKTGLTLDQQAIPQLLNYLNMTKLPLGLVLFFGPKPQVRRLIRDSRRDYLSSPAEGWPDWLPQASFISGLSDPSVVSVTEERDRSRTPPRQRTDFPPCAACRSCLWRASCSRLPHTPRSGACNLGRSR